MAAKKLSPKYKSVKSQAPVKQHYSLQVLPSIGGRISINMPEPTKATKVSYGLIQYAGTQPGYIFAEGKKKKLVSKRLITVKKQGLVHADLISRIGSLLDDVFAQRNDLVMPVGLLDGMFKHFVAELEAAARKGKLNETLDDWATRSKELRKHLASATSEETMSSGKKVLVVDPKSAMKLISACLGAPGPM